jgi:site-specific DNA-methyltransferase (adenine-specific)
MSSEILPGDVFSVLPGLEKNHYDCCVTSPPYWRLRSYLPKNHPDKHLELGQESTPLVYVGNLVRALRLVRDALAPHGTCWLNLGDTYAGAEGSLCLIPWRVALALSDDGWLVRSVVVWQKPSAMPANIRGWSWVQCRQNGDGMWVHCPGCKKCSGNEGYFLKKGSWRPTSSWEPVLLLARGKGYYADGEAVRTPAAPATLSRDLYSRILDDPEDRLAEEFALRHDHETVSTDANLRDVWPIPHEPLAETHYAAFPTELVRLCLASSVSEKGYCAACGAPWARKTRYTPAVMTKPRNGKHAGDRNCAGGDRQSPAEVKTLGWHPTCHCPDPSPRPGRVLDPFCGSGRTGVVSRRLGLDFVGIELSARYADMARALIACALRELPRKRKKGSEPDLFADARSDTEPREES